MMSTNARSTESGKQRAAGRAIGRSAIYAALSALLAADEAGLEAVRSHVLPSLDGEPSGEAVQRAASQLGEALGRRTTAELLRSHGILLPPVGSGDPPASESAYYGSEIFRQAQQMADIAGFYRAHGLTVGGSRRERPDHVSVELEFMAVLTAKEADALLHLGPDQVEMCRDAQALFLEAHLGRWVPTFARRLAERADDGPYRAVAEVLDGWIAAELEERGVSAAPPVTMGDPLPMIESAGDGCAFEGEGGPG